ncbi:MAG TPA: NAD(P)H-hydrate epimerase, partial [Rubricoccaceae bacterium]
MTELTPILTSDGMRAAEAATVERWDLPARVLMESAGRAAADVVVDVLGGQPRGARVAVVCGPGDNGGDGFVVARVLHAVGASVTVVALSAPRESPGRAANLRLAERLAETTPESFRLAMADDAAGPFDAVVDALLGIGATGSLRTDVASLA